MEEPGQELQAELNQNVDIGAALAHVSSGGRARPGFFQIFTNGDEKLPWETLWKPPQNFFACQVHSPIGRMASGSRHLNTRALNQPALDEPPVLRVLAVLVGQHNAPYQIASDPEWDRLYDAKQRVERNQHLRVELDVLVDDPNLEMQIQQCLPRPAGPSNGRVSLFADKQDLKDRLEFFRPHLLHFFCHGAIQNGGPHLLLGTNSGQMIRVTPADILDALKKVEHEAWLCVLNCCQSGQSPASGQSFARALVGARIPVVVGMAEPITTQTAHAFTKAFYREVFGRIDRDIRGWRNGAAPPPWETEWVEVTFDARGDILEEHNQGVVGYAQQRDQKCWTLPILYTVPGVFRYEVRNRSVAQQVAASVVATVAATLLDVPDAPERLHRQLAAAQT